MIEHNFYLYGKVLSASGCPAFGCGVSVDRLTALVPLNGGKRILADYPL